MRRLFKNKKGLALTFLAAGTPSTGRPATSDHSSTQLPLATYTLRSRLFVCGGR